MRLFSPPHAGLSASANIALSGLKIPCGQCIGCRLEYSRQWAMRCHHEASLHTFKRLQWSQVQSATKSS
jgi:hypothetical protein